MADTKPLRAGDELPEDLFQGVRQRLVLDAFKWDPQVGDVSTISRFPLLLSKTHWGQLSHLATLLAATLKLTPLATLKLTPSYTLDKEGLWTRSTPIWSTCMTRRRTKRM